MDIDQLQILIMKELRNKAKTSNFSEFQVDRHQSFGFYMGFCGAREWQPKPEFVNLLKSDAFWEAVHTFIH